MCNIKKIVILRWLSFHDGDRFKLSKQFQAKKEPLQSILWVWHPCVWALVYGPMAPYGTRVMEGPRCLLPPVYFYKFLKLPGKTQPGETFWGLFVSLHSYQDNNYQVLWFYRSFQGWPPRVVPVCSWLSACCVSWFYHCMTTPYPLHHSHHIDNHKYISLRASLLKKI